MSALQRRSVASLVAIGWVLCALTVGGCDQTATTDDGDGDTLAPDDQLGTGTIIGTVVDGSNPDTPVPETYVYIPVRGSDRAAGRGVNYAQAQADADGRFSLTRVPAGSLTLVVEPPAGSGYAAIEIGIDIGVGATLSIRITVTTPAAAGQVAAVTVTPQNPTVNTGATQQFSATATDAGGHALDLDPTWVTTGGVGTIDATGLFVAGATPGSGEVYAIVGDRNGSTAVTVQQAQVSDPAALKVTPASLDFGASATSLTFAIANTGGGTLAWSVATTDAWITALDPPTGVGPATVTVGISREGLSTGTHTGEIAVTSTGGDATVTCSVGVAPATTDRIAFESSRTGNYEIWVMAADGTNPVNLTHNSAWDEDPAWSPDGSKMAFASTRDGGTYYDIFIMDADGGNVVQVTDNNASYVSDHGPSWSPDGRRLAFASDRGGDVDIYTMSISGADVVAVTDTYGNEFEPAWSPVGNRIADAGAAGDLEVFVTNADGTNRVALTDNEVDDHSPAWSPDGARMAFQSCTDGWGEIYVMEADGSNLVDLTNHPDSDYDPTWSPDGAHIAWATDRDGNHEIYVMDADGTDAVRLTTQAGTDRDPAWCPVP